MSIQLGPNFDLGKSAEAAIEHTDAVNEAVKLTNEYVAALAQKNAELVSNLAQAGQSAGESVSIPVVNSASGGDKSPARSGGVDPGTAVMVQTLSQAGGVAVNALLLTIFGSSLDQAGTAALVLAIQGIATIVATAHNNLRNQ
jgi:hypothetical protein